MDDDTFAWCLFQEADADGSGGLDRDEIRALARSLGNPLSEEELNVAMREMDEDGGGSVEFDEFLAWFRRVQATTDQTGWAKELLDGAKDYMFKSMAGRDTGHKFQFSGGLADRLKAAEQRRKACGRAFKLPTMVGLRDTSRWVLDPPGRPLQAPRPLQPEPEPEPEAEPPAEPESPRWGAVAAAREKAEAEAAAAVAAVARRPPSPPAAEAEPAAEPAPEARQPRSFWCFPWELSATTAHCTSFEEQAQPEETPLERLSGRVRRARVLASWSSGDSYEGEWSRGEARRDGSYPPLNEQLPDGLGAHVFEDGAVYVGEWKAGQRHGQGRMQHASGDCYVGHFKADKYHGSGTLTYANGSAFKGSFASGLQHGSGTFTLPDGLRYCAEFREGRALQFRPFADGGLGDFDYEEPAMWASAAKSSF